ncbi:MAG: CPBP family intramembrane metalloprotease [Vampirovibrio sp.]|nr:CPBP family intramembrane metalloprotease [Vampirovibrio sp.]
MRRREISKDFLLGMAGVVVIVGLGMLLQSVADVAGLPTKPPYEDLPVDSLRVLAILAIGVAPMMEEVVFRGLIQTTLYRYFTPWKAICLTAVIFACCHFSYGNLLVAQVYVLMMGILLGILRHRSGSVYPGVLAHTLNNTLVMAGLLAERG